MELLSPVGDFDCLKAAAQNGADAVYFGGSFFNARMNSSNFGGLELKTAIEYAKTRNVKTYFTLNTLIKNGEFSQAVALAKQVYELGIDSMIVQDLGLAKYLINYLPELPIHGSTQMTIHNLEGALTLEKLGFTRVVLSRELSLSEIEHITKNAKIETEVFIHGALCMSYSGQCLMSSMIGGRSGNRGKCAGTCRLPYQLQKDGQTVNKGYLLSPRDLCGLEYLPQLIKAGVACGKIEGRMKTPEYVGQVTKIYRKYIDLAQDGSKPYKVEEQDKKDLLQIFNRGGNSTGHLSGEPNKHFVFTEKPGNTGVYIGSVLQHNNNTAYIKVTLAETIALLDTIQIGDSKYNVSEIVDHNQNVKEPKIGQTLEIGRVKGDIQLGDKVYKIASKELTKQILETLQGENKKIAVAGKITIKSNEKISMKIENKTLQTEYISNVIPEPAKNVPITKENVMKQINKTGNTPYEFAQVEIELGDNLFVPNSALNEVRREALEQWEHTMLENSKRTVAVGQLDINTETKPIAEKKIAVLFNQLNEAEDYTKVNHIDYVYIPLHYFLQTKYAKQLEQICNQFHTYIYAPIIMNETYSMVVKNKIQEIVHHFNIKGMVLSNLGQKKLFEEVIEKNKLEVVANYSMNVFNSNTIEELKNLDFGRVTISPELTAVEGKTISNTIVPLEQIVYGRQVLMTTKYCFVGESNKCYSECGRNCEKTHYQLKDRMNFVFPIMPNNIENTTTILNSKITSIVPVPNAEVIRIELQEENIEEINRIIQTYKQGNKLEGQEYTNGNSNREV